MSGDCNKCSNHWLEGICNKNNSICLWVCLDEIIVTDTQQKTWHIKNEQCKTCNGIRKTESRIR